jgi:uncharacterized membrane protein
VLLGDRDVEIVADRGCNGRVSSEEWASVCRAMESSFRGSQLTQEALAEVALNFLSFSPRRPSGEFRVAIEAALEAFGRLSVWDPDASNGALMYVRLADRDVETVADRGCNGRVSSEEWASVCAAPWNRVSAAAS